MAKLALAGKDPKVLKALPNIPLGPTQWSVLNNGNFLVVDKTAKIADLVAWPLVFLARPRRMGKSTLCSMLYELFTHGTSKFVGTKVYDLWPEEKDRTYPVISLQFNDIASDNDVSKLDITLRETLLAAFITAGFPEVKDFSLCETLIGFLHQFDQIARQHRLVFLIDEWDCPLSNTLDNEKDFNVAKNVLRSFYSWLRGLPNLRFVLVTGIMRYRETSLFSGQSIQDLSMDPDFADLLGYTQDELEHSFAEYIPLACEQMHLTKDELLENLKVHYDGFCFDYDASVKVYCPYAVNKFFAPVKSLHTVPYFGHYWMTSANANKALTSYLHEHVLEADELKQIVKQEFTLPYQELTEANYFGTVKFKQLLVQAGYFSIKSIAGNELDAADSAANNANEAVDDPDKRKFHCGITNKDVEDEFVPVLTKYLLGFDEQKLRELDEENVKAQYYLLKGDIEQMCRQVNLGLCKVGYNILHDAKEVLYAFFLDQALRSKRIATAREEVNNLGRSDLVAETKDHIYVFELKRLSKETTTKAEQHSMLDEAEQQLLSRGYGSNRMGKGKPITGVALVICDHLRQICAWRAIDLTADGYLKRIEGFVDALNIATQQQVQQGAQVQPVLQWMQMQQGPQAAPVQQGLQEAQVQQGLQAAQVQQILQWLQGQQLQQDPQGDNK